MRVYFEKPRTTVGWKGLINDPAPRRQLRDQRGPAARAPRSCSTWPSSDCPPAASSSIRSRRSSSPDLVSWGAIGARTTGEPGAPRAGVGPLDAGRLQERHRRRRPDRDRRRPRRHASAPVPRRDRAGLCAIVATRGNPDCHVILRGGAQRLQLRRGQRAEDGGRAASTPGSRRGSWSTRATATATRITAGSRSSAHDLAEQIAHGESAIFGVMMESFLVDGRQDLEQSGRAALRTERHRRVHGLGDDVAGSRGLARGRPRAPEDELAWQPPRRPTRWRSPSPPTSRSSPCAAATSSCPSAGRRSTRSRCYGTPVTS